MRVYSLSLASSSRAIARPASCYSADILRISIKNRLRSPDTQRCAPCAASLHTAMAHSLAHTACRPARWRRSHGARAGAAQAGQQRASEIVYPGRGMQVR